MKGGYIESVFCTHLHHRNIQPIFTLHYHVDVYVFKPIERMVKMFAKPAKYKSLYTSEETNDESIDIVDGILIYTELFIA